MAGCTCGPNGLAMIVPSILLFFGFIMSIATLGTCNFIRTTRNLEIDLWQGDPPIDENVDVPIGGSVGFGLFSHEDGPGDGSCTEYSGEERELFYDSAMKTAAAFGATATAFGFFVLFFVLLSWCVPFNKCSFIGLGLVTFLTGIFQIVTLLAYGSDVCSKEFYKNFDDTDKNRYAWARFYRDCEAGPGAILAIVAGVLYWISSLIILIAVCACLPKRAAQKTAADEDEEEKEKDEEKGGEDEEEEVNEDEEETHEDEEEEQQEGEEEEEEGNEEEAGDEEAAEDEEGVETSATESGTASVKDSTSSEAFASVQSSAKGSMQGSSIMQGSMSSQ